jgi:hypothetical protein
MCHPTFKLIEVARLVSARWFEAVGIRQLRDGVVVLDVSPASPSGQGR